VINDIQNCSLLKEGIILYGESKSFENIRGVWAAELFLSGISGGASIHIFFKNSGMNL
jgi:hypothetical protein